MEVLLAVWVDPRMQQPVKPVRACWPLPAALLHQQTSTRHSMLLLVTNLWVHGAPHANHAGWGSESTALVQRHRRMGSARNSSGKYHCGGKQLSPPPSCEKHVWLNACHV